MLEKKPRMLEKNTCWSCVLPARRPFVKTKTFRSRSAFDIFHRFLRLQSAHTHLALAFAPTARCVVDQHHVNKNSNTTKIIQDKNKNKTTRYFSSTTCNTSNDGHQQYYITPKLLQTKTHTQTIQQTKCLSQPFPPPPSTKKRKRRYNYTFTPTNMVKLPPCLYRDPLLPQNCQQKSHQVHTHARL